MSAPARPLLDGGPGPGVALPPGRGARVVAWVALAVLVLAVVRQVTGVDDVTSSGTFGAALRLAVPIGLAGLGGLYAERSGILNLGLEGMMILGTWFGGYAGWLLGPWWGVGLGILAGAVGGLVLGIATIHFGVDHIIAGVAINILALGVTRFLSGVTYTAATGGGVTQSPPLAGSVGEVSLPVLAGGSLLGWRSPDLLGSLERTGWLVVADVAGMARGLAADVSWLTILALALVAATAFFVWQTPLGLRLRACGEHPVAAESLGVPVYRLRYLGVLLSGALAGFGGAFLVVEAAGLYQEGQTGGRGFIGLAALIFGNWRPGGVAAGAGLFGFADALQLRDRAAVHALLLGLAVALVIAVVLALRARRRRTAAVTGAAAAAFLAAWLTTDAVPTQFLFFTPHVVTLLVLALAARRLRPPAAEGQPYRKGDRG